MQNSSQIKHLMTRSFFHFSALTRHVAALFLLACLAFGAGCAPAVGDACETSTDCPGGVSCDTTAPDGYCLIPGCERGDCPNTSICVEFDRDISYCLESCEQDSDCRDEYACRRDVLPDDSPLGFCYVQTRAPENQ